MTNEINQTQTDPILYDSIFNEVPEVVKFKERK